MAHRAAVEDMEANHHVCWMLDLPGCFSSARTQDEAVALAPARIAEFVRWIGEHDPSASLPDPPFDVDLVETFDAFPCGADPEYLVNAFFEDDRRPLTTVDIKQGLRTLEWSRRDLWAVIEPLSSHDLDRVIDGERRGSISGILDHLCRAENWYLGQLGLETNWARLPDDLHDKLAQLRAHTRRQLARLANDFRITESCEETWSARKILRRTLWHELAHTEQIRRLTT